MARSSDGPRGDHPLPLDKRDDYENLILLCEEHHKIIDANSQSYSVEMLHEMKNAHEKLIEEAVSRAVEIRRTDRTIPESEYVTETVHSPLLPVVVMPKYVYLLSCEYSDRDERLVKERLRTHGNSEMHPFIIRGGWIYCFQNPEDTNSAFHELQQGELIERLDVNDWIADPDAERQFQQLLNRALNKLTGRKGLNFDKTHKRYYFMPKAFGEPLSIQYKGMNQATAERSVVWQPITRKTGLPKNYWLHRAVQLRFMRTAEQAWVLSIRPGFHVSTDGHKRYPSENIGKRVNKKMIRMFNYEMLAEIHFWRDYLSDSKSHIIFPFGNQTLQLESSLLQTSVTWPGIPEEHSKSFANADYETDMFLQMELDDYNQGVDDETLEDWEYD